MGTGLYLNKLNKPLIFFVGVHLIVLVLGRCRDHRWLAAVKCNQVKAKTAIKLSALEHHTLNTEIKRVVHFKLMGKGRKVT